MIPTIISLFILQLYILQTDRTLFLGFFLLFICFFSGKDALNPGWLSERFPTEVRATAAGFIYHQGAVWGAAVAALIPTRADNDSSVRPILNDRKV
jgi:SHS family lactate transporter-like MFS transporter